MRVIEVLNPVTQRIRDALGEPPGGQLEQATRGLFNNLTAISATIILLCKDEEKHVSTQGVAVLMRSLIEACASILFFSTNPKNYAARYLTYGDVMRYRLSLARERHIGCHFVQDNEWTRRSIQVGKAMAKRELRKCGAVHIRPRRKGKTRTDASVLKDQLSSDKSNRFFQSWHGKSAREILRDHGMSGLADIIYMLLCSAVHSDVWADKGFCGERSTAGFMAVQLWGTGVLALVEGLGVPICPQQREQLEKWCRAPLGDVVADNPDPAVRDQKKGGK